MAIRYKALALQARCDTINRFGVADARQQIFANIDRIAAQIATSKAFIRSYSGDDVRLVVVPEYFLTGFPLGESIPEWQAKAALDIDGAEYERLAAIAQKNKIFLSGNAYENDPNFPDLYFQTSFLFADNGDCVLRYRRLVSMFAPTPHDVLSRYLDVYGEEALFPVAKTELGCLAAIASEEILYPEIARALALRGAEVFLHSTSEIASPGLTPKDIAKRARAIENLAYVVSANSGGLAGTAIPEASSDGMSKIVDSHGRVLAESATGETMTAVAELDIDGLRAIRKKPGMTNTLARQRNELFVSSYQKQVYPANTLLTAAGAVKVPERSHFVQTILETIVRTQGE